MVDHFAFSALVRFWRRALATGAPGGDPAGHASVAPSNNGSPLAGAAGNQVPMAKSSVTATREWLKAVRMMPPSCLSSTGAPGARQCLYYVLSSALVCFTAHDRFDS